MEFAGKSDLDRWVQPLAAAMSTPGTPVEGMALAVSSVLRPQIDPSSTLQVLDRLADLCRHDDRDALIARLFTSGLFRGDRVSYHDWRNSCLDQVVARRRGMPITLAIVATAVGRRVGLPLVGVGMPGHFLVGDGSDPEWFADPFHGTSGLRRSDCRQLAGNQTWSEHFLDPTPDRLVIARVLNNLRSTFQLERDPVRLALVLWARQTMPEFASELREAEAATAVFN